MPAFKNAPIQHEKPYLNQPFMRVQDEGRVEYAVVNGIRELGSKDRWIAHLTSGFQEFREVLGHDKKYANTADWHPVPESEIPHVRRILDLEAVVLELTSRVARLEAPTSVEAAPPVKGDRPSRGASASAAG